jgi:hypothetical protein
MKLRFSAILGTWFLLFSSLVFPFSASAQVTYTDWTSATAGNPGSALGTMGSISVSYSGEVLFAQTSGGGINYWAASSPPPYNNPAYDAYTGVPNMPPDGDIIALAGGTPTVNTISFSQPVINPIMLVLSLGQPSVIVQYDFAQPFTILSSGNGYWGGNPSGSLSQLPGDILSGEEGHGAIQFNGTFSSISWTAAPYENWHGFTIGFVVPEPSTVMLLGFGFALFAIRRCRGSKTD